MQEKIFISTAIPYVNGAPHLGHALEFVEADAYARMFRAQGNDVFFSSGTDDNSLKNVLAAEKEGMPVDEFVKKSADPFRAFRELLNISYTDFIGTREERHRRGVERFWRACKREDIYKKEYEGLYCIGCEEFKTILGLVDGKCPEHPSADLETIKEENYFFRLSVYSEILHKYISEEKIKILPESRKNEMLKFIESGLHDFSISRSRERARGWGIPVPDEEGQVIYVWFDALVNYISILGYGGEDKHLSYWKDSSRRIHLLGKGVSRFHALYWPAMLLSAGLPLPTEILVHDYITIDGKKISKSEGVVIDPQEVVGRYGIDATRYFLLREIPSDNDGDFSWEKMATRYEADLANGLGNFASRVTALASALGELDVHDDSELSKRITQAHDGVVRFMKEFKIHEAVREVWDLISFGDRYANEKKPWDKSVSQEEKRVIIANLIVMLDAVTVELTPFLPDAADKIAQCLTWNVDRKKVSVTKCEALFPRIGQ